MHNAKLAQVGQRGNKLLEKLACFLLLEPILRGDEAEELSIAAVLHDEKQLVWSLNSFV